jgi:hypothetical protein
MPVLQGPYRDFSIDISKYADARFIPLLFAGSFDPEVQMAASDNDVILMTWDGGAVDLIVPPRLDFSGEAATFLFGAGWSICGILLA